MFFKFCPNRSVPGPLRICYEAFLLGAPFLRVNPNQEWLQAILQPSGGWNISTSYG